MRVRAQIAMVMNLDKCIGCHTCSVTCKQVWTNRPGTEYVWFNNVETKPGLGYPRTYEDQERWQRRLDARQRGRLQLKAGGRCRKLLTIFWNPDLPTIDDYYEPWTYDYQTLIDAPLARPRPGRAPALAAHRRADGGRVGPQLGRQPRRRARARRPRPAAEGIEDKVKLEYEQAFMFYLPRICEHCLNPSLRRDAARRARCTSAARTGSCSSTRTSAAAGGSASRAARTRRSTSTTAPARPRSARSATRGSSRASRRSARRPASAGSATSASCSTTPTASRPPPRCPTSATSSKRRWTCFLDPDDPEVQRAAPRGRDPRGLARGSPPLARLHARGRATGSRCRCTRVPDAADGLVRPAAVAGGRTRSRRTATRPIRTTSSRRSRRCGSRSSTWPTCSPRATSR